MTEAGELEGVLRGIVDRSVRHRWAAIPIALLIFAGGLWAAARLALDVTPDISNRQVQILTRVPDLAPEEIETSVTRPLELEMFGIPGLEHVRSLTRFGVSQVTLVFSDATELYRARQMVTERMAEAAPKLPPGLTPRLGPPTSGSGEICTYALTLRAPALRAADPEEAGLRRLKLLQEFVVKPWLKSVPGVAEVNTTGGYDQQMDVEVDPAKATQLGLDLTDIANVVERNAAIGGGALIDRDGRQLIVRSRARPQSAAALVNLPIKLPWAERSESLGTVARIGLGSGIRLGAATFDGREAVLGTAMMVAGGNARSVANSVRGALADVQARLPADVELRVLYDRGSLISVVVRTMTHNLLLAGGLVLVVLLVFLRSWRAALIVTSLLVLSFALCLGGMVAFGIGGSLLTLGAIDFGVVVDDTIVMVENVVRKLAGAGRGDGSPAPAGRRAIIVDACCQVRKPMLVGMLVIIGAYVPILTLGGVEGRMFRPLALAVIVLLASSLVLTLTLVPALCAVGLESGHGIREPRFVASLRSAYGRLFLACRRRRGLVLTLCAAVAGGAVVLATRLGADFLPALDEGWLVVEVQRDPAISLARSVAMELESERAVRAAVPEVEHLFSRMGMSDVATDPQGPNENDLYVSFRPRSAWRRIQGHAATKAQLAQLIVAAMQRAAPRQELELNQPVQVRFDEQLDDARTDVAIKLYGPDYGSLDRLADQVAQIVRTVPGAGAVVADHPGRVAMREFVPDPARMARYLASGDRINAAVSTGLAGREVGRIDEGEMFYPLVVRLSAASRADARVLDALPVSVADDTRVLGLGDLGKWRATTSVGAVTREHGVRRETVAVTVDSADAVGFVAQARAALQRRLPLPGGYRLEFSGAYRNWQSGSRRLAAAGGAFLCLSLLLVYAALRDWRQTGLVALGVPFALVGGIYGLGLRGLPLTLPAAIGLVVLGGLSVLNGMVLITTFNERRLRGIAPADAALQSAQTRLRPVLMTALVAGVGFLPMAFSSGQGAELQRPFATVVVFGILTSTALTLLIIPLLLVRRARAQP